MSRISSKLRRIRQIRSTYPRAKTIVDRAYYLSKNPDVAAQGMDPVQHFITHGEAENREFNSWHSPAYVRSRHPTKSLVGVNTAQAYMQSDLPGKPRLVFVSHDASRTGAPAIILRLIEMFSQTGAFECFTILDKGGDRLQEFEAVSHCYVMSRSRHDWSFSAADRHKEVAGLFSEGSIFDDERPMCALVNSAESHHIGQSLGQIGVPVVSLLHEFADFYPPSLFEDYFRFSQKVIFPSQFIHKTASHYCELDQTKAVVRGQGLLEDAFGLLDRNSCCKSLRETLDLPDDARIVLNVGTLDQRKGVDLFAHAVRAYVELYPEDTQTYFVWYGHGEDEPGSALALAKRVIDEADIGHRLRFQPPTNQIEQVFLGGDLFLLTARADPFPCVIHEAMACRLPVIAFQDGGGAQELIGDACGTLVEMGDIHAMAHAIARYVADPELCQDQAERAKRQILRDWRYEDYFRDVMRIMKSVAPSSGVWDAQPPKRDNVHLVILRATQRSLESFETAFSGVEKADVEVLLLDGRFSADTEKCITHFNSRGIAFRVAQPLEDSHDARREVVAQALSKPRPAKVTLVDTLEFSKPKQLKVINYPISAVQSRNGTDAEWIYPYLPYLTELKVDTHTAARAILGLNPSLENRLVRTQSKIRGE